jgi:hypothetical protein
VIWRNRSVSNDQLVATIVNIFRGLGYTPRAGHEEMETCTEWKATFILSPSFIAEVKYANSDITSPSFVSEKPLNWINATLLSGQTFLPSDDLRLKVCTVNELEPDDAVYRRIFLTPSLSQDDFESGETSMISFHPWVPLFLAIMIAPPLLLLLFLK